ncbi:DUF4252 domain containing protein [Flavobacterium beibuense]|uniref:DUF4252 domain containing protein n=2 Tax=Flavobacterium beibuense TaxID=657326 RepID=A0A444W417_9FLAO|nr:DUF4252 domain containing protein [Flavobacterium beibuense]
MRTQEKQFLKNKTMKKFIAILVIMLSPVLFYAQSAFDKFDDKDGIDVVSLDKTMLDLAGDDLKLGNDEQDMVTKFTKDLQQLKIYSTEVKKYKNQIADAVKNYVKDNKLESLVSVKDDGETVKIYARHNRSDETIEEVLVFVDSGKKDETVLVTFTGKVKL